MPEFVGTIGADSLVGTSRSDVISGLAGADTLSGLQNNDLISGGAGNDLIFGYGPRGGGLTSSDDDTLLGGLGADSLYGGARADLIFGGDGRDLIDGGKGADLLDGGSGNDVFLFTNFLEEDDTIDGFEGGGAPGGDSIVLRTSLPLVFAGEAAFTPTVGSSIGGADDGVAQLIYTHDGGNTILVADRDDNGVLDAGDFTVVITGEVTLTRFDFRDTVFLRAGTEGDDTLNGTAGADTLAGLAGNDRIDGRGGADRILGAAGNDTILSGTGADTIFGGDGDDSIVFSEDGGLAIGGAGNDTLVGGAIDNVFYLLELEGNGGNDSLVANGPGEAVLDGGAGADTLFAAGTGPVDLEGGDGGDTLIGGVGDDFLSGGSGRDKFILAANFGTDDVVIEDGRERIDLRQTGLEFSDLSISLTAAGYVVGSSEGSIIVNFAFGGDPNMLTKDDFFFA